MISDWKISRNLSSLLRNLTYLPLLNSLLFLSRFSVSLKTLDNYFLRWFAYKSLLSRFSVLISYNMCSSNHFSISSGFPCFSRSRFFRVQVFRVQGPESRSRIQVQVLEVAFRSSCSQMFFKIDVLKNFAIFTGKSLLNVFCTFNLRPVPADLELW